jgi:hypothetical protein
MRILRCQEGPLCHQGKVQLIERTSGVSWTSGSFVFFWYFMDLFTCFCHEPCDRSMHQPEEMIGDRPRSVGRLNYFHFV